MDKIDYLEKELTRLLGWINSANSRISLVLTLSTVMLGVLAALIPNIEKWTISSSVFSCFACFFLVLSIICIVIALFPKTSGIKGSMIFFGGIKDREMEQYRKAVHELDEESYIEDLINQCHINASIADTKFTWVKRSLIFLFISSPPWFISVFLLYGIN